MKTCATRGLHNPVCITHGGAVGADGVCATFRVLEEVARERARQYRQYGTNSDLEDGTGPSSYWLGNLTAYNAEGLEHLLRGDYARYESAHGKPTWMHLVREEVSEVFAAEPEHLEEELIQVAALCVSWVEKIRARQG